MLPTVKPRLRAPLPHGASARRGRPAAREPQSPGPAPAAGLALGRSLPAPAEGSRKSTTTKTQPQAFLVRADFIAATRPRLARSAGNAAARGARAPLRPSSRYRAPGSRGPLAGSRGGRRSARRPTPDSGPGPPSGGFVTVAPRKAGSARRGEP